MIVAGDRFPAHRLRAGEGTGVHVLTRPGRVLGTVDYHGAGLIRGQAQRGDRHVRIRMHGLECVTGPPFAGRSMIEVGMAHLEEAPPIRPQAARPAGRFCLRAPAGAREGPGRASAGRQPPTRGCSRSARMAPGEQPGQDSSSQPGARAGEWFDVAGELVIGRETRRGHTRGRPGLAPSCRRHARRRRSTIEDRGSTNGTHLNGNASRPRSVTALEPETKSVSARRRWRLEGGRSARSLPLLSQP